MHIRMKAVAAIAAGIAIALAVTGCSGPSPQHSSGGSSGKTYPLTVAAYSQPTLQPNFNPFSLNALRGTVGLIYEQLFDFNTVDGNTFMPALATAYKWGPDGTTLDITLDKKAKWSDGSAVTAKDVAFTFQFMASHKLLAFDMTSVKTTGTGVELAFGAPAYAQLQQIGRTTVVPEKLWKDKNPDTELNLKPLGSGPYTLGNVTGQQVTFVARRDYWAKKVPVPQINFVTTSNTSLLTQQLVRHEVDLAYAGIPDVQTAYVAQDKVHNHLWPVFGSTKPLLLNLKRAPFDDVNVRKGISLSIDRGKMLDATNPGAYVPVSPTGLYQKTWADWIPAADRDPVARDKKAALAAFAKAGYELKGGKLVGADGKQLTLQINTVSAFADGMAYCQELASQLTGMGIAASVNGLASAAYTGAESSGDFDSVYGDAYVFGQNPYGFYSSMLSSSSKLNIVGWNDPTTQSDLAALAKAAPDEQKKATLPLQKILVDKLPTIPISVKGTPYMYSTLHWTGWPDAAHPYTVPDPGAISGVFASTMFLALKPA